MEPDSLDTMSLNQLIASLHTSLVTLEKNVDSLSDRNKRIASVDTGVLRDHISRKLLAHEEEVENKLMLQILELFREDKTALQLVKNDLDNWMKFLDAMKKHVEENKDVSKEEAHDIERLKHDITQLQNALQGSR